MSFRQLAGLGQIVQWDIEKLKQISAQSGLVEDEASLTTRLSRAKYWLETYYPAELIRLRDARNEEYIAILDDSQKGLLQNFKKELSAMPTATLRELEVMAYRIPKDERLDQKENGKRQRAFFGMVYQLLLGKDTGPRLSTFLWAADRNRVLVLLQTE